MTDDPPILGFTHDRFKIIKKLGQGGMGTVYECLDRQLEKSVAVKVLSWSFSSNAVPRFQKEARILAQLQHPNILSIRDFDYSNEGGVFLVTDMLPGKNLDDIRSEVGYIPAEEALPVFIQICDGLSHAHKAGILHRDIKPANIMIVPEDDRIDVFIMDFGFARLIEDDQRLTRTGVVLGTPSYMSPEQADIQPVDVRSDIYSLGCSLFEVLTGHVPYHGKTIPATMLLHMNGDIPKLSDKAPNIKFPPCLDSIINKCLAKSPNDRYQTVSELREALVAAQSELRTAPPDTLLSGLHSTQPSGVTKEIKVLVSIVVVLIAVLSGVTINLMRTSSIQNIQPAESVVIPSAKDIGMVTGDSLTVGADCDDKKLETALANLKQPILELNISDSLITDAGIKLLANQPLEVVTAKRSKIGDEGLKSLARIKTLSMIDLTDSTGFTGKGLEALAVKPSVTELFLSGTTVDDGAISAISKISTLKTLVLERCTRITDKGVEPLAQLQPSLKELYIGGTMLTDASFSTMGKLNQVTVLNLDNCQKMNGSMFTELRGNEGTLSLSCRHSGIDLKNLSLLSRTKSLVALDLSDANFQDKDVDYILPLKSILELKISNNPNFTNVGLRKLGKHNHSIERLYVVNTGVTDAGVIAFEGMRKRCTVKQYADKEPRPRRDNLRNLDEGV
ncbi:MAG: protein kinase [Cyanobacteria bacterium]|nr:protein kinase [Cyanobacteriota bacterium]